MNWKLFFLLPLSVFLLSCTAKDNFVVLSPSADGSFGSLEITTIKGSAILEEEGKAIYIKDSDSMPSQPTPISSKETAKVFQAALEIHPVKPESFLLYFKHNSNELTTESQIMIDSIFLSIDRLDSVDVELVGHTDRTGEDNYNQQLSLKRAKAVSKILTSHNLDPDIVSITYHGEGNPLIPTADNVSEPKNRRVEVMVR